MPRGKVPIPMPKGSVWRIWRVVRERRVTNGPILDVECTLCGAARTFYRQPVREGKSRCRCERPPRKRDHPLYETYGSMMDRCYNERSKMWHNYGQQGVTVCDRWVDDFWNFVEDMPERPDGYIMELRGTEYNAQTTTWVPRRRKDE